MKPSKQTLIGKIKRADDFDQLKEVEVFFKKHFGQFKEKTRRDIMHAMIHKEKELKGPDKKKAKKQKIKLALVTALYYLFVIYILRFEFNVSLLWSFIIGIVVSFFSLVAVGLINHYKN